MGREVKLRAGDLVQRADGAMLMAKRTFYADEVTIDPEDFVMVQPPPAGKDGHTSR